MQIQEWWFLWKKRDYGTNGGPLAAMQFQQAVEQKAFQLGGGKFVAPALRMTDLLVAISQPRSLTVPIFPVFNQLHFGRCLTSFVYQSLAEGFSAFGQKMRGYFSKDAVVVATESRTSSPVRIPRNADNLQHPQIKGLYPAGEGAGYAGGIVSAAMDGERISRAIIGVMTGI